MITPQPRQHGAHWAKQATRDEIAKADARDFEAAMAHTHKRHLEYKRLEASRNWALIAVFIGGAGFWLIAFWNLATWLGTGAL